MTSCCSCQKRADVSSWATPDYDTTHMDIDWTVDFSDKRVKGNVTLHLKCATAANELPPLLLDSKGLHISAVQVASPSQPTFLAVPWRTAVEGTATPLLETIGEGLFVDGRDLAAAAASGGQLFLRIEYTTDPTHGQALCWLDAAQTQTQVFPYVYSQCQAIHARTLLPCQDTPSVRSTYTARVSTNISGVNVLMSALALEESQLEGKRAALSPSSPTLGTARPGTHCFYQAVSVPSYLIALAAGNIVGKDISPRCRVYAEPSMIDAAAWEFEDVETFVATAEEIAGPYVWQRYDLLVLPPSFPFGGMENPNLTFVTPTLVCGDRSLVDVVIHEICHSWSGNLVSVANWSEFWLNEGWTMFLQRKVTERLRGRALAEFDAVSGARHLQDSIDLFGADHEFTKLRPRLDGGADPDDAFSSVPYEKGYAFVRYLERHCGSTESEAIALFSNFIKTYFSRLAHKSIRVQDLQALYQECFPQAAAVAWDAWCDGTNGPLVPPTFDRTLTDNCVQVTKLVWNRQLHDVAGLRLQLQSATEAWTDPLRVGFFEILLEDMDKAPQSTVLEGAEVEAVGTALRTLPSQHATTKNTELLHRWLLFALRQHKAATSGEPYVGYLPTLETFLDRIGRLKFVRPLFRSWFALGGAAAKSFFDQRADAMHPVTRKMLGRDFTTPPQP